MTVEAVDGLVVVTVSPDDRMVMDPGQAEVMATAARNLGSMLPIQLGVAAKEARALTGARRQAATYAMHVRGNR